MTASQSTVFLVLVMLSCCNSETPAHVQSKYGQLVTSSTLTWVRSGLGMTLPPEAVSSGTGDGVICRGHVSGVLVSGFTSRSRCMVAGTGGRLVSLSQYHVLTHVHSASKLKWVTYERFSPVPIGAVAGLETGETVFIGRVLESGVMRTSFLELGSVNNGGFGSRIAVYSSDDKVHLVSGCDILVEVEPISYQLFIETYDKKPKITTEKTVLATSSMFRFEEGLNSIARMTKMVSYTYEKSLYFGHIKGVIKGLPTKIKMPTGESRSVIWGRTETDKQGESRMVEYSMDKNTAVDFEIIADQVEEEKTWSGRMVSVFSDGSIRERNVLGATLSSYLDKIQPVYSNPHRIKQQYAATDENNSELETTKSTNENQLPIQQETIYVFNETDELTSSSNRLTFLELRNFIYFIASLLLNKII